MNSSNTKANVPSNSQTRTGLGSTKPRSPNPSTTKKPR